MSSRIAFMLLCHLLLLQALSGQQPVMQQFTVADGMPGGVVYYTTQDRQGYIWIGTDRGLVRFDGNEFMLITVKEGLPSNEVWGISEDEEGRLWLDTFNGVCYVKDGKVHMVKDEQLLNLKEKVTHYFTPMGHIIQFKRDNFFSITESEILKKVSQPDLRWIYLPSKFFFSEDYFERSFSLPIRESLKLKNNQNWLILDNQLIIDQESKLLSAIRVIANLTKLKDPLENDDNRRKNPLKDIEIISVSESKIILYVSNRFYDINKKDLSITPFANTIIDIPAEDKILSIKNIAPNSIWIKTLHQNIFVDSLFNANAELNYLKEISLNNIFYDQQGSLWLSSNNGLFFMNQQTQKSQSFQLNNKNQPVSFNFITKNDQPVYWCLNSDGFLYRMDPEQDLSLYFHKPIVNAPTALKVDFQNNLWASGSDLVKISTTHLKAKKAQHNKSFVEAEQKRYTKAVKNFHFLDNNSYVATTFNSFIEYKHDNPEFTAAIVGRHYGLAVLDKDHFIVTGKFGTHRVSRINGDFVVDSIPLGEQHHILHLPTNIAVVSKDKVPWLAVNNIGLYRWDKGQLDSISELSNVLIQSLYIDSLQRLWACTNIGLAKIQHITNQPFSYDFQWIRNGQGLISNDVNDVLVDKNKVVVATDKGITILSDSILNYKNTGRKAPLLFSELRVNGTVHPLNRLIDLTYQENNLLIKYQCLDFQQLGEKVFQYQLVGIDQGWIDTRSFEKEYAALSPGAYTFLLRRKPNPNNPIPSEELSLTFTIHPPFWLRGWFISFVILLFVFTGWLFYRYQVAKIEKRSRETNELNKKFAELELNALQSQMNPHFVFNALNSIQDFIFRNDARIANRYLVKFSRLMRLFLESSKEKTILLSEEIQLLELYIELEQLRFEGQFEYEIKVAENFSPSMVAIPSMLLQPFVENAINHGLIKLSKPGKLLLYFEKTANKIHCRIEDNGHGINKHQEQKTVSVKEYKSRGMQLVKERQRVWNIIGDTSVQINITDLAEAALAGSGTRVDIFITIEN